MFELFIKSSNKEGAFDICIAHDGLWDGIFLEMPHKMYIDQTFSGEGFEFHKCVGELILKEDINADRIERSQMYLKAIREQYPEYII